MLIGICDDNAVFRNHMVNIIKEYEYDETIEVVTFCNGNEVLDYPYNIDILLLDIEMEGVNGIDVKESLQSSDTLIIIITSYEDYALEGYGRNVIGFIRKDEVDKSIKRYLNKAALLIEKSILVIDDIQSKDILYIKSEGKYVRFRLKEDFTAIYDIGINKLGDRLSDYSFVRVHKSLIVNMKYIKKVNIDKKGRVTLTVGDDLIPVSQRRKTDALRKYKTYLRRIGKYI